MHADLPPVFDHDVLAAVADDESVSEADLREAIGAVQKAIGGFTDLSVDDIVYEWRTQHHKDPLVNRTPEAYYLDVRTHVWDDVLERAAMAESLQPAVRALHSAQFARDRGTTAPDGAMVLDRT